MGVDLPYRFLSLGIYFYFHSSWSYETTEAEVKSLCLSVLRGSEIVTTNLFGAV